MAGLRFSLGLLATVLVTAIGADRCELALRTAKRSRCPSAAWKANVSIALLQGAGKSLPLTYVNAGANKGFSVAEYFAVAHTNICLKNVHPSRCIQYSMPLRGSHIAYRTYCLQNTLPIEHITNRTHCLKNALPQEYIASRAHCLKNTLPQEYIASYRTHCLHNTLPQEYIALRTPAAFNSQCPTSRTMTPWFLFY